MSWEDTIKDEDASSGSGWESTIRDEVSPSDANESQVTAATTHLAQGSLPFGLAGTLAGAGKAAVDAISGVRGPLAGGSFSDIADDYHQVKADFEGDAQASAKSNPMTALGMELVGGGVGAQAFTGIPGRAAEFVQDVPWKKVGGKLLDFAPDAVANYARKASNAVKSIGEIISEARAARLAREASKGVGAIEEAAPVIEEVAPRVAEIRNPFYKDVFTGGVRTAPKVAEAAPVAEKVVESAPIREQVIEAITKRRAGIDPFTKKPWEPSEDVLETLLREPRERTFDPFLRRYVN
jgi:hypothetical protein